MVERSAGRTPNAWCTLQALESWADEHQQFPGTQNHQLGMSTNRSMDSHSGRPKLSSPSKKTNRVLLTWRWVRLARERPQHPTWRPPNPFLCRGKLWCQCVFLRSKHHHPFCQRFLLLERYVCLKVRLKVPPVSGEVGFTTQRQVDIPLGHHFWACFLGSGLQG